MWRAEDGVVVVEAVRAGELTQHAGDGQRVQPVERRVVPVDAGEGKLAAVRRPRSRDETKSRRGAGLQPHAVAAVVADQRESS
jgi:hypothetical protein